VIGRNFVFAAAGLVVAAGIFSFYRASRPALDPQESPAMEREPEIIRVQGDQPRNPNAAPEFTLTDLTGRQVSLSSYRGKKVVIMEFWATWCKPCRMTMPMIEKFWKKHQARGVELLSVNQQESRELVKRFVEASSIESRVLLDLDAGVATAFGVYGLPTLFVIDKQGVLRYKQVGFRPDVEERLERIVAPLL